MGRGSCAFKEADVKRAVRAVKAAGQPIKGVRFTKEGGFTVIIGDPNANDKTDHEDDTPNTWDRFVDK